MRVISLLLLFLTACEGEIYITKPSDAGPDVVTKSDAYPKHLSWAAIDTDGDKMLENYVTSIKRQPCGDCYVYAAVGLYEIQYHIDHKLNISLNLSEQNLHNCLSIPCDAGGDYRGILDHIRDYGVMEEIFAPTGSWGVCENCSPILSGSLTIPPESVMYFRLKKYETVIVPGMPYDSRRDALVGALQSGPVAIMVGNWSGWLKGQGDVLTCWLPMGGGHSVVAVGYRDFGKVFLIKNSHGGKSILKMAFNGADKCGFAFFAHKIPAGQTYTLWGGGESFCYSSDDRDKDGIPNVHDNCPYKSNVFQLNSDKDRYGDACDKCPKQTGYNGFSCPKILGIGKVVPGPILK